MSRRIDFYFDFPSPYAYLAHTQLPRIATEHGATVDYHPFRILELMKIVVNRPTTIECKNHYRPGASVIVQPRSCAGGVRR